MGLLIITKLNLADMDAWLRSKLGINLCINPYPNVSNTFLNKAVSLYWNIKFPRFICNLDWYRYIGFSRLRHTCTCSTGFFYISVCYLYIMANWAMLAFRDTIKSTLVPLAFRLMVNRFLKIIHRNNGVAVIVFSKCRSWFAFCFSYCMRIRFLVQ